MELLIFVTGNIVLITTLRLLYNAQKPPEYRNPLYDDFDDEGNWIGKSEDLF